jgi:hypothetical protein
MNEEGATSATHSQTSAAGEPVTAAIVRQWWLLATVAVAQVTAAAALRVVPLSALRAGTTRCRRFAQFSLRVSSHEHVAWAIEATGRRLGRASSCLARAVVAEMLFGPAGGPVSLTLGVRHSSAGAFEAHAWVTSADRVLVGAPADGYTPVVTWTSPSA